MSGTRKYVTPSSWRIDERKGITPADLGAAARRSRRGNLVALLEQATAIASTELALETDDNTSALELLETCSKAAELARKRLA